MALAAASLTEQLRGLVLPAACRTGFSTGPGLCCSTGPTTAREHTEVSRGELRQLLLDSLPDGVVHWGRKVNKVQALARAAPRAFADGATATASVLIVEDGAW